MEDKKIKVERELFESKKTGKMYYTYFIKGAVRGKEFKLAVIPPDNGGYVVLDIVFNEDMEADLVLKPYEIKDEKTGTVVKGNTYAVVSVDGDGKVYECPVKPQRISDKSLLNMLVN